MLGSSRLFPALVASVLLSLSFVASASAPTNDGFAGAITVASLPFTTSVDASEATLESGEPSPPCAPVDHTVWFRFTTSRPVRVVGNVSDSDFTVVGAVYRGSSLSDLKFIACLEDVPSGIQSKFAFDAFPRFTYFIQLGSFGGADAGTIQLRMEVAASIEGTVRGRAGKPLAGAFVSAYDAQQRFASFASTDASGRYKLTNLSSDGYRVSFEDLSGVFTSEWYDNKPDFVSATVVPVSSGGVVTGIDATLAP